MKSKAPLAMMEQLVMVLIFSLAAALCLQVFILSDQLSHRSEAQDHAVIAVQNAAETLKSCYGSLDESARLLGGKSDGDLWQIGYDAEWQIVKDEQTTYQVLAVPVANEDALQGAARITARTNAGEELFEIMVSWQEVAADE